MPSHDSPRVILAAKRAADRQRYRCQLVAAADLVHGDIFFLVFDKRQPRAAGATSGCVSDYVRSSRALQVHVPPGGWRRSPPRPPAGSAAGWCRPASRLVRARRTPRTPPYRCCSTVSPASFWLRSRAGTRPIAVHTGRRPDPAVVMPGKEQMRTLLRRARHAELRGGLGARG